MILIENISNKVILSAGVIELFADYAKIGNKKYYGGITDQTHTLIENVSIPYGQASWWQYINNEFVITDIGLNELKEDKKNAIRTAFESVENSPVEVNTVFWNGGYESAQKLDGAKRMAELMSLTTVTFYDVNNIGHDLSIPDAETVITGVGVVYQTLFQKKQNLFQQIDSATTVGELDGIYW